tara:strand:+ start:684 stop:1877 length:1194 start_codon:yes stop_codon:yes gene_type:complete
MSFKKIIWSNFKKKSENDVLCLSKKDINHLARVAKTYNIEPESLDEIHLNYVLDRGKNFRFIIKECDYLLKKTGIIKIKSVNGWIRFRKKSFFLHSLYLRSYSQIKHEFSICTQDRYIQISEHADKNSSIINPFKLTYRKNQNSLNPSDSIDCITFGIITNGANNEGLIKLLNSIIKLDIPNFEIIICGGTIGEEFNQNIKLLKDVDLIDDDIRAPITKKKNEIVKQANFENIFLLHDRYYFDENWYTKMVDYGNYFDVLLFPNLNDENRRMNDYTNFKGNPSEINYNFISTLNYTSKSNDFYCQGGALLIKKYWYNLNKLDDNLYWQELEDVQFSKLLALKGACFFIDIKNPIYTKSSRLGGIKANSKFTIIKEVGLRFIMLIVQIYYYEVYKRRG